MDDTGTVEKGKRTMTQSKPKVEVRVDSCGAAAIVYLPTGERLSARQCAEQMIAWRSGLFRLAEQILPIGNYDHTPEDLVEACISEIREWKRRELDQ